MKLGITALRLCPALWLLGAPFARAQDQLAVQPLTPALPPGAPLRFAPREGAGSGFDFRHTWQPPELYRGVKDRAFAGGGVAVGDVDGDGRPDVAMSRPFGGVQLFKNLGSWKFQNITEVAGLAADAKNWSAGINFADVDNDGDLDLWVSGFDTPNRLFFNNGSGAFADGAVACGLAFKGATVQMYWADYDRDGDLDGFLLTNRAQTSERLSPQDQERVAQLDKLLKKDPNSGRWVLPPDLAETFDVIIQPTPGPRRVTITTGGVELPGRPFLIMAGQLDHLYRNDGPGADGQPRFTDVTTASGVTDNGRGQAALWWDYDQDGWPDLYVANDFYGPDRLWHNNRDGTFTDAAPKLLQHTPWFSMGCDSGDLNNDGRPDFIATDMAGSNHYKDKMGMGDMDQNGWFLDVPTPRQYTRNAVYLNPGAGLPFMEMAHLTGLAATDWTWAVKLGDLDCDGWLDVYVTNGMTGDFLNSDLRAKVDPSKGTIFDAPPKKDVHMSFRNTGQGLAFEKSGEAWGLARDSISFGAAFGDLDGDGDLDLIVNNFDEPASLYDATGGTGQRLIVRLIGTNSNRGGLGAVVSLTAGGVTQTRWHTTARGFFSSDEPLLHFGLGTSATVTTLVVRWPTGTEQQFENLEAGRAYTITEPAGAPAPAVPAPPPPPLFAPSNALATATHREKPFDDFALQPLLPNKMSQWGPGQAWGDVDADGDDDFWLGGAAGSAGRLYFNEGAEKNGKPQFVIKSLAPFESDAASEDMGALFLEADGDGDLDLFVVSGGVEGGDYQDRLYLNDGKGTFTKSADRLPAESDSGSCVVAADVDRDGDLDLFLGGRAVPGQYPLAPPSRLLLNNRGTFTAAAPAMAPQLADAGMVTSALWSDVDGDGWPDLLLAREWGSIGIWMNRAGEGKARRLQPQSTAADALSGWWNGLAAADLDNDGDPDYVAGNFGLNTKYHPTPDHPQRIYYADFDGTGKPQIVEAKTLDDQTILPVRGKSCSQNAMPFLKQKFPTFHQFASSTLEQIYAPEKLAGATQRQVTTLDSGIFWNDTAPGGPIRLSFEPLPRLAQIAPVFGIACPDVDLDGRPDLVLAQNFFHPQRETGRMDGSLSLLLLNQGKRTLTPVWPIGSGIALAVDGRALTLIDLDTDGRADLVFAPNDSRVRALRNQAATRTAPLALRLAGSKGNPQAVGARVSLRQIGLPLQSAEATAGSGYLSQSTSTLFFAIDPQRPADAELTVTWPGGSTTRHSLPPPGARHPWIVRRP